VRRGAGATYIGTSFSSEASEAEKAMWRGARRGGGGFAARAEGATHERTWKAMASKTEEPALLRVRGQAWLEEAGVASEDSRVLALAVPVPAEYAVAISAMSCTAGVMGRAGDAGRVGGVDMWRDAGTTLCGLRRFGGR